MKNESPSPVSANTSGDRPGTSDPVLERACRKLTEEADAKLGSPAQIATEQEQGLSKGESAHTGINPANIFEIQTYAQVTAERDKLREQRDELLAACKEFVRVMENPKTTASMPHTVAKARAAIKKAEAQP